MTVLVKLVFAAALLGLVGLPIVDWWTMFVLVAAWLALACSDVRLTRRRILGSAAIVLAIVAARAVLPRAAIEEGHNIFFVGDGETVLQQGLPRPVYQEWRHAFETQYPPDRDPSAVWRTSLPLTLYAGSSDALWRPARYSRTVDTIAFENLSEFRGGFANDIRYNFFGSDAISQTRSFRADLPFFVRYQFSAASVDSTLYWRGVVFWERSDGSFEEIAHAEAAGRPIRAEDVGRSVYALHLPAPISERPWERDRSSPQVRRVTELSMRLELSPRLAAARMLGKILSLVGIIGIFALMISIDHRRYLAGLGVTALGMLVIAVALSFSEGKYLGPTYPPHGGGDDGLTHESTGRTMARALMAGDWIEALRGGQDVYVDTPGMRYGRCVERVLFGDTNLGYAAFLALQPWFVYLLLRHLAGFVWSWLGVLGFLLSPVGSPSFLQYIRNAKLGYAEAMAFGFLILGTYLLLRSQPRWRGQPDAVAAFCGGGCLAGAMFLRPNLALAVPLVGLLYLVESWRSGEFRILAAAIAGLALALWMPLHNYVYGHQFVLISAAGATISVPIGPAAYLRALQELAMGNFGGEHVTLAAKQLSGWLWTLPDLPVAALKRPAEAFMVLKLVTLGMTALAVSRWIRVPPPVRMVAWAALAAHLPMLFIFASAQFRYAMIGWDLSALVTIAVIAEFVDAWRARERVAWTANV